MKEDDESLPFNLEEAHAEIIRLRDFRTRKEKLIKEVQADTDKMFTSSPSFRHLKRLSHLIDSEGCKVSFPTSGFVALYFSMPSCPACRKFEPTVRCLRS